MPSDKMYLPIQVGKEGKSELGYIGDNTGENISSKNPYYCELTGIYWAWKNLEADYIGLAHYRRHFTVHKQGNSEEAKRASVLTQEELEKILLQYDVVVPNKRKYYIESNYSHYIHAHHKEGLDKVCEIIEARYPEYQTSCKRVMNRNWAHMFNMFVMKKFLFQQYCTWMFDILEEVERTVDISNYSASEARIYGYLSELMLDIWLEKNQIKYKELSVMFMEKQNWLIKGANFVKRKFSGGLFEK